MNIILLHKINLLETARNFAQAAHAGQKYGKEDYYDAHIKKVENIIRHEIITSTYYTLIMMIVANLHDVVEDCDISLGDIEDTFGSVVAGAVYLCTDGEGENRKERKEKFYEKYRDCTDDFVTYIGATVKVADRLANFSNSKNCSNDKERKMYATYIDEAKGDFTKLVVPFADHRLQELYKKEFFIKE